MKRREPSEKKQDVSLLVKLNERVADLAREIEKIQIADYIELLNSPRKLIVSNIISGIARGVGFAIGFTIFTTTIFFLLKKLGALDLPIVGDYIAELVKIVQVQLEGKRF